MFYKFNESVNQQAFVSLCSMCTITLTINMLILLL